VKKNILLATLILGWLDANAQQRVFELPLEPTEEDGLQTYMAYDPNLGSLLLTLASRNKIDRYKFSQTDSLAGTPVILARTQVYDKDTRKGSVLSFDHYLGCALVNESIEESVSSKDLSRICFFRTKYGGNKTIATDSILIPSGERLIATFYQNDQFYALSLLKTSNTVRIYHHRPEGATDIIQKDIPVKDWGKIGHVQPLFAKKKIDDLSDLIDNLGMLVGTTAPPLLATLTKSKIYVQPGKVYLTFDNTRLTTWVAELPLDNRPCRIQQFSAETYYQKEVPPGFSNGNSFIIDSTLIAANIIHLKLYLAFYDLSTGQLRKVYLPDEKGNPTFPHSPVWQVGNFWKKSAVHTIGMGEFAKNSFDFWTLGVGGHKYGDHQFELEIGTIYDRETFGKFMVALGSMGGVAAMGSGILIFPGPGSRKNTMFLRSQFHSDPFSPLSYKELEDKSQLIDTFVDSKKISLKGMSMLELNNNYWLGYFDKEEQKYIVYKF